MTPRFANLRRGHLMRRPGLFARILRFFGVKI